MQLPYPVFNILRALAVTAVGFQASRKGSNLAPPNLPENHPSYPAGLDNGNDTIRWVVSNKSANIQSTAFIWHRDIEMVIKHSKQTECGKPNHENPQMVVVYGVTEYTTLLANLFQTQLTSWWPPRPQNISWVANLSILLQRAHSPCCLGTLQCVFHQTGEQKRMLSVPLLANPSPKKNDTWLQFAGFSDINKNTSMPFTASA